jgi:hypothetical protein
MNELQKLNLKTAGVANVSGWPRRLLRLEGMAVFAAALVIYAHIGSSWWLFAGLFFVPDLSMLGYLAGQRTGAMLYNLGHWYAFPAACIAWGCAGQSTLPLIVGLIWAAHIGLDRALGYGLKYAEGFGFTHLGKIGAARLRS